MTTQERAERVLEMTIRLIRANARGDRREISAVGESALLLLLSERKEGMTAGEICEATGQGSGRTANLLKSTEAKGYVVRTRDFSDGRKVVARLTPAGRKESARRKEVLLRKVKKTFETLGEADSENACRILEKLLRAADGKERE